MVVDCGPSRRSWLPRPTVVGVARTESLSVSTLARTVVGASTVPPGADAAAAAGDGADAADAAGGAVCAIAAGWSIPKPAASAPSERTLGAPGKRVSAAAEKEAEGSNGR